jgi:hypothetical protein
MSPPIRRFGLTLHVVSSVGWFGAVASFLALAIYGLIAKDAPNQRIAYGSMELMTSFVIVPFCLVSLATGLVQSVGTPWGLLRHYWVLLKLLLTVFATVLLLMHMQPIREAALAASTLTMAPELLALRIRLVADSAAALVVLGVTTVLGIYKPRGLISSGSRQTSAA